MTAILLSGGMDSIALAWWKRPRIGITVDYGQRAAASEFLAAEAACEDIGIEHVRLSINCSELGSGDMADRQPSEFAPASDWWPFRNQLLITLAGMLCIQRGASELLIGCVASDATHVDGRQEFVARVDELTRLQEGQLRVLAPALHLRTAELIRASSVPAGVLAWAHSCHKANIPCGDCRGCTKYQEVYEEVGYDLERA